MLLAPLPIAFVDPITPPDRRGAQPLSISVIIPALDEAQNLPFVLPRIPPWVDEVLLVDGGSSEETVAVARSLCPNIRILSLPPAGKGAALRAGLAAAAGDILVLLDADGSTDPAEIPTFVGALLAGAAFVESATATGPHPRDLPRRTLSALVGLAFHGHPTEPCCNVKAVWARALDRLDLGAAEPAIAGTWNARTFRRGLSTVREWFKPPAPDSNPLDELA